MPVSGTDSLGNFLDTGVGTLPTQRVNTEQEVHIAGEFDSGSKLTPTVTLIPSHIPHRDGKSPR